MENEVANEILKQVKGLGNEIKNLGNELNEFRKETNERFDGLETRVDSLEKTTKENTKAIKTLEKVTEDNTLEIIKLKAKMDDFGEQRKKDRLELMDVLQRMDKSISKRFDDIDASFERIYALQTFNDVEHVEYRQAIRVLKMKDNIFAKRLQELEEWKKDIGSDLFAV